MNNVILTGRLTKEPETRYTAENQTAVTTFVLAVNRMGKDKGADFPRVTVFGKQAENVATYCKKGAMVGVQGRIQTGSYEKDGQKIYTTDVIADRVEFLGKREAEGTHRSEPTSEPVPQFASLDEDIPF